MATVPEYFLDIHATGNDSDIHHVSLHYIAAPAATTLETSKQSTADTSVLGGERALVRSET